MEQVPGKHFLNSKWEKDRGSMKNLVIAGAGEFGRELYWTILDAKGYGSEFTVKGYVDSAVPSSFTKLQVPLLGTPETYEIQEDDVFTCAIGNPISREKVIRCLLDRGAEFINIIHKTSIIHGNVRYGIGLVSCAFTSIGDSSEIGDYVVLNGFSGIGHDSIIGDFTCIMSHCDITGRTKIGKGAFIGGGAGTVPGAKIGDGAYVGAGSVVLKKVNPGAKVFGNPAVEI